MTKLRILFAGTPVFAAAHLRALIDSEHDICAVLTQPDRRSGRGKKVQPSPVKALALEAQVDVMQPLSLKDEAIQAQLRALQADVMVVVAYGLILPQAVLDIPRYGCLNVHASLLPRWRGAAPIQRAIEYGDATTGVTIMQMEAGLDTGPMLAKHSLPIDANMTGGELHDRLAEIGPPALLEVLSGLPTALASATAQDDGLANYAHKINKAELLLDWGQPAEALARKIRAFAPAPGCFSTLTGDRIKIHAATASGQRTDAAPGTLLEAEPSGLLVACAEGALKITRAQVPGGKPLTVTELLNGQAARFRPGIQFNLPEAP
jgi:methionyl-tRNA formyltransferase